MEVFLWGLGASHPWWGVLLWNFLKISTWGLDWEMPSMDQRRLPTGRCCSMEHSGKLPARLVQLKLPGGEPRLGVPIVADHSVLQDWGKAGASRELEKQAPASSSLPPVLSTDGAEHLGKGKLQYHMQGTQGWIWSREATRGQLAHLAWGARRGAPFFGTYPPLSSPCFPFDFSLAWLLSITFSPKSGILLNHREG